VWLLVATALLTRPPEIDSRLTGTDDYATSDSGSGEVVRVNVRLISFGWDLAGWRMFEAETKDGKYRTVYFPADYPRFDEDEDTVHRVEGIVRLVRHPATGMTPAYREYRLLVSGPFGR
jgi:hypothetical protein